MVHPLVRLLATEPHLVADHVGAYADLIGCEAREVQKRLVMRIALSVVALFCVLIAAVLTGVALMLWAVTPGLSTGAQWALGAAPAVPAIIAILTGLAARRPVAERAFASIKEQISADLQMIREARSA